MNLRRHGRRAYVLLLVGIFGAFASLTHAQEKVGITGITPSLLVFSTSAGNVIASVGNDGVTSGPPVSRQHGGDHPSACEPEDCDGTRIPDRSSELCYWIDILSYARYSNPIRATGSLAKWRCIAP